MSLVAAYSDSDTDSEDEDRSENVVSLQNSKNETGKGKTNIDIDVSQNHVSDEVEESATTKTNTNIETSENSISDEDEENADVVTETGSSLFSILPQPKMKSTEVVEETDDEFIKKKNVSGNGVIEKYEGLQESKRTLMDLPKPSSKKGKQKVKITIPSLAEIGADSDSEDDETSKSKKPQPPVVKRKSALLTMLPKPKHSVTVGTNRNKVFSYEANRPLIPHTLSKKKEVKPEPKKVVKTQKVSLVADFTGSDDDEDIESSSNFFSLGNDEDPNNKKDNKVYVKQNDSIKSIDSDEKPSLMKSSCSISVENKILNSEKTNVSNKTTKGNTFFANLYKSSSNVDNKTVVSSPNIMKTDSISKSSNDNMNLKSGSADKKSIENNMRTSYCSAPVTEKKIKSKDSSTSSVTAPYSSVTAPYPGVTAPYSDVTAPYSDVTAPYSDVTAPYSDVTAPYGNMPSFGRSTGSYGNVNKLGNSSDPEISTSQSFFAYPYGKSGSIEEPSGSEEGNSDVDYYHKPNEDLPIDKDAIIALQGNRRRKEEINLIDVNAADIQANSTELLKHLTSEQAEMQREAAKFRNEKDQPTTGQKRKHQITYLAYQAKERELQLQQAWSESYATKRQTQSKYGF